METVLSIEPFDIVLRGRERERKGGRERKRKVGMERGREGGREGGREEGGREE